MIATRHPTGSRRGLVGDVSGLRLRPAVSTNAACQFLDGWAAG